MMYFTYGGTSSLTYGVRLTEQPIIARAERRVKFDEVPGRDGTLATYDGAYNDVETELACYMEDVADLTDVFEWLSTDGDLVISTDTTRSYRVQVVGQIEVERVSRGMTARYLRIPVRLAPFRYHAPAVASTAIAASGNTITNPGTYASRPRIKITAGGDFSLTANGQFMEFAGVTSGIIVDSDYMDCFNMDGATLANSFATLDEFPTLKPGINAISWTGAITAVEVLPRWRDL